MHLEPIYLVAPEPEPKAMPTRRAWLFASGAFVTGALSGTVGAGIFTGGTRDGAVAAAALDELDEHEARELRFLHELCADSSPLATLEDHMGSLLYLLAKRPDDRLLWHGMERLAQAALDGSAKGLGFGGPVEVGRGPRRLAGSLLSFLRHIPPGLCPTDDPIEIDIDSLRAVARGR